MTTEITAERIEEIEQGLSPNPAVRIDASACITAGELRALIALVRQYAEAAVSFEEAGDLLYDAGAAVSRTAVDTDEERLAIDAMVGMLSAWETVKALYGSEEEGEEPDAP